MTSETKTHQFKNRDFISNRNIFFLIKIKIEVFKFKKFIRTLKETFLITTMISIIYKYGK